MRRLTLRAALCAAGITCIGALAPTAHAIDVDLRTWSQEGEIDESNWNVAADGSSVLQTVNGGVGLFVSPESFFDTTIKGQLSVETTADDDMIGFVFGYQGPVGATNDTEANTVDFLLFDWKRAQQSGAEEGFFLSYANGQHKGTANDVTHELFQHESSAGIDVKVLGQNTGTGLGWQSPVSGVPVVYDFTLAYTADNITIEMAGGQFGAGQTIFDVDFASLDAMTQAALGGAFPSGQFGFYNYSQEVVRYNGFTRTDNPPDDDDDNTGGDGETIPTPAAGLMGATMLGLLGMRRSRRPIRR